MSTNTNSTLTMPAVTFGTWKAERAAELAAWEAMSDEDKVFHKLKTHPTKENSPILLPKITRVFPTLIAQELIGIQPMVAPAGIVHTFRPNYNLNEQTKDLK